MQTIRFTDFKNLMREAALDALDTRVREILCDDRARGWTDAELPALFAGIDAHAATVAARINQGKEPGTAAVRIDMEEDKPAPGALTRAIAANKSVILAFLDASGPQEYEAIRQWCSVQAYADHASIQAALRELDEAGKVRHELAWNEEAKDFRNMYDVTDATPLAHAVSQSAAQDAV